MRLGAWKISGGASRVSWERIIIKTVDRFTGVEIVSLSSAGKLMGDWRREFGSWFGEKMFGKGRSQAYGKTFPLGTTPSSEVALLMDTW